MLFSNPSLIIGLILWFVGFIFILNGINMMDKMSPKECGVWNLAISVFMFVCIILSLVFQLFGEATWLTVGGITLFAFTYFMIGMNNVLEMDARGLGYYCLLVAMMTPFIAEGAFSAGDWRFGVIWLIWGVAWFVFYLIMALEKTKLATPLLGRGLVLLGLATGVAPGYMMLRGWW
jgi:hypothetical protein